MSATFDNKQIIEKARCEVLNKKLNGEIPESEVQFMNEHWSFCAEIKNIEFLLLMLEKTMTESVFPNIKGNFFFRKIKNIKFLKNFYKRYFASPINRQNGLNEIYFELLRNLSDEIKNLSQELLEIKNKEKSQK